LAGHRNIAAGVLSGRAGGPPGLRAASLVHFCESKKPWRRGDNHYAAWLYLKYLERTPFYAIVVSAGQITPPMIAWRKLRYGLRRLLMAPQGATPANCAPLGGLELANAKL
jgi:hypothetical protein